MFVLLALHIASSATSAEAPGEAAELIEKWLAEKDAPGISAAAVNRDGILWSGGGWSERRSNLDRHVWHGLLVPV